MTRRCRLTALILVLIFMLACTVWGWRQGMRLDVTTAVRLIVLAIVLLDDYCAAAPVRFVRRDCACAGPARLRNLTDASLPALIADGSGDAYARSSAPNDRVPRRARGGSTVFNASRMPG
jgi:hypothetical protein